MNPDNARILRITAAAGTELADAYSCTTVTPLHVKVVLGTEKKFTALWVVNCFCQGINTRTCTGLKVPEE